MSGESHRIYWRQRSSEQRLLTSSAAVRMTETARARDVTDLLNQTLSLTQSSLILVGTIYGEAIRFPDDPQSHHPMHVVRTLHPDDLCLEVRDAMLLQLKDTNAPRQIMTPKLQWMYVADSPQIPKWLDLDGYATGMEEEEEYAASDNEEEPHETDASLLQSTFPWMGPLVEQRPPPSIHERHRKQLSQAPHTFSGYLLHQSRRDPNLWRPKHCILTDSHLWFVSRIYEDGHARYGRLRLTRTLLLESPDTIDLVDADGRQHIFRASSSTLNEWKTKIRENMVESFENSLMEQTERIVAEKCQARRKRQCQFLTTHSTIPLVLRVGEYRELCRYLHETTPHERLVRHAWNEAQQLWEWMQQQQQQRSRSTESLGRHVEYVLNKQDEGPPPMDLLDRLLASRSLATSRD